MKIITSITEMQALSLEYRKHSKSIGLVPTMGYLHAGHQSLIEKSHEQNNITIVSIFVNPTQFAPNEDFAKYPRDLARDCELAVKSGADIIFHPNAAEMYPENYCTYINIENLTTNLCGKSRPSHFRGVTTVVAKLFNITLPHRAYFGQKDAQQLAVITAMARDLNMDVQIVPCPIVRESDGLALSSRNVYLSQEERAQAPVLYKSLQYACKLIASKESNCNVIKNEILKMLNTSPLAQIEYVEIVDFVTLTPIQTVTEQILIALAVKFGNTRLIDNVLINNSEL